MNIAILTTSVLALACSATTMVIMYRTAKKLDDTAAKVKGDVETFKAKTDRNLRRVRSALGEMEF